MTGGRATKEILIKGEPTKNAALAKLSMEFEAYRRERGIQGWRWIIVPEARKFDDGWRAYGRMEKVAENRDIA
jgi:hypothetical protein